MRKATAISTGLHAAVLLWATLSFSGKTFEVTPAESLPVDMISEKDFSQLTKGAKDAPKLDMPKPLAEKKAEEPPKPVEDSKPKVTEKKEVQAAKEMAQPPEPQPAKPDPIAEKIKQKDEPKQETNVDQP
jgi:colicin import membrane protein